MPLLSQTRISPAPAPSPVNEPIRRVAFPAMGTACEIQYVCDAPARAAAFETAAVGWVNAFEAKYSRFREDSLVSRINAAAGTDWVNIDEDAEQLLRLCDTVFYLTQGILDPTLLPLIRLWNYKAEKPAVPSEPQIAAARRLVGWQRVLRAPGKIFLPEPGMALDFGGFGKEYAVDVVAQIATDHGIANALIDFGHDLRVLGKPSGRPAWHVGLEDPRKPGTPAGSVALAGSRGIASSGDYVRRFTIEGRRFGHIIDPRTGWPVANGCTQATVIAGTCLHAGVLSTAAFVLGPQKGIEFIQSFPGAEGLIVMDHGRAQTRGFFHHVVSN
jgi:thiamine biosynthesis lipoprotein